MTARTSAAFFPLLTVLVTAALSLTSCSEEPAQAAGTREDSEDPTPQSAGKRDAVLVRVEPVRVDDLEQKLEVTARVESLDVVDVMTERAEPVIEVLVEEGDEVEEDQVLARLRSSVAAMSLADRKVREDEALNALEQKRRDHKRNEGLAAKDSGSGIPIITDRELEVSAQEVVTAETAHEAAKVATELAQHDFDCCTIRSRIKGTVTARDISVGSYVSLGARAFQVTDLSAPKAVFYRPQRVLGVLHPNQRLTATSEAMPGEVIEGEIERISPTIDPVSGTVKVTAALRPARVLPTGILVEIELVLDRHDNALLVPKQALLYEGRSAYCFVVREGVAHRVDCRPGFEDPEFLEVLPGEDSLQVDDVVVVVGADRLADGDPVELAEQ